MSEFVAPPALLRRTATYQAVACLLVAAVARWRLGPAAAVAVLQGGGLVAFNLHLGRLLAPSLQRAWRPSSPDAKPQQLGRLAAICGGKLALQLGVAAAVMLGHPPAPLPFLLGLTTLAGGAGAALLHQLPQALRSSPAAYRRPR